jgi:hypothetical protein
MYLVRYFRSSQELNMESLYGVVKWELNNWWSIRKDTPSSFEAPDDVGIREKKGQLYVIVINVTKELEENTGMKIGIRSDGSEGHSSYRNGNYPVQMPSSWRWSPMPEAYIKPSQALEGKHFRGSGIIIDRDPEVVKAILDQSLLLEASGDETWETFYCGENFPETDLLRESRIPDPENSLPIS